MDDIVKTLQTVSIGTRVADFLLNTNRFLDADKVLRECLILLDNRALETEKELFRSCYERVFYQMIDVYRLTNDWTNAVRWGRKLLVLLRESSKRDQEGELTFELAQFHYRQYKYEKAKELYEKALSIMIEINEKKGETACYGNLGRACLSLCEYAKAKEYLEKGLAIAREIGDKKLEAGCYGNLGNVFYSLCEYSIANEYHEKALAISKEVEDRETEARCYENLAENAHSLCKYAKAKEYFEQSLVIKKEIGDRSPSTYQRIGAVLHTLGDYAKAKEYFEKSLEIAKEIGDRKEEFSCCEKLGSIFQSLGEYVKAKEYFEKALAISKEIGDKGNQALAYSSLGIVVNLLGEYCKAIEYHEKAIAITKQVGDRKGEITQYALLGTVFSESLGNYAKVKEYVEKAIAITQGIGNRKLEASCYGILGKVFKNFDEYDKAKKCHANALSLSKEIGDIDAELVNHAHLSMVELLDGNWNDASSHLLSSIHKSEDMRSLLGDNDQLKISLFDRQAHYYRLINRFLFLVKDPNEALYLVELGRARALADLMAVQYLKEKQISVNLQTRDDIENIMNKEKDCSCLYISYYEKLLFLWILKADEPIISRQIDVNSCIFNKGLERKVDDVFGSEIFRKFYILPPEQCEDRSWFLFQEDSLSTTRLVEDEEDQNQQPDPTLAECYNMIIAPIADLLCEAEVIIVPDRSFFKVPFAALEDRSGTFLSENFRIRIIPSLTTLKLIQDSPADYHSETGALIVGDPDVGEVLYKGRFDRKPPLPKAREEAEKIGGLLGVQPLLGKQATKQAVLQRIHSVSLIHFAAHGNAERGEIVLSPQTPTCSRFPQEEDYLLTMTEISQVRLRAKLVVLSCCHSASGHVKAEGVVGIARAFLGSGARSVLVALWAIEDLATKEFMIRFYEHLVRGERASESLHQAMKWMRRNGFSKIGQWAPFMLIGDNVTLDCNKISCR